MGQTSQQSGSPPPGVVMILVNATGREVAVSADFGETRYGGFDLRASQEMRAKKALARKFIDDYCSPDIAAAIPQRRAEDIVGELVVARQWRRHVVAIGQHPSGDQPVPDEPVEDAAPAEIAATKEA